MALLSGWIKRYKCLLQQWQTFSMVWEMVSCSLNLQMLHTILVYSCRTLIFYDSRRVCIYPRCRRQEVLPSWYHWWCKYCIFCIPFQDNVGLEAQFSKIWKSYSGLRPPQNSRGMQYSKLQWISLNKCSESVALAWYLDQSSQLSSRGSNYYWCCNSSMTHLKKIGSSTDWNQEVT